MPKRFLLGLVLSLAVFLASSVFVSQTQQAFAADPTGISCTGGARCPAGQYCQSGMCFQPTTGSGVNYQKAPEIPKFEDGFAKGLEEQKVTQETNTGLTLDGVLSYGVLSILGDKPVRGEDGKVVGSAGLVPSMGNYMAMMYGSPPASTQTYVADLMDSAGFNLAQPAYAQGLGFSSLNPILETWKIFRNVAYFFFVIIFLVIGFMIMFRQKISGQTVVTAQQAIPQVIVALLAVTFSYAIGGLLIDIMYLFMYLLVGLFGQDRTLVTGDIFAIGGRILTDGTLGTVHSAMDELITGALGVEGGSGTSLVDHVAWLGGLAFAIVFAVALAIGIFRLFFELLKTYVDIIISIVAAPLVLMLGAIPGRNTFGGWLKSLFGNLAVFPIVTLVLIIFYNLKQSFTESDSSGFLAPYLIGQGTGGSLSALIGMGFILIMPDVVKQAKKALGVTGGVFEQFGQAMGDAVKRGWTGGELIPGLGFTNTAKWPMGGLSGQNIVRKGGILGGAAVGGATGATLAGVGRFTDTSPGRLGVGFGRGSRRFGQFISDMTGDKELYSKYRKERTDSKTKGYGDK